MWSWKLVTAPLRITTPEDGKGNRIWLYEDRLREPFVCIEPLIERFNFPLDAERYWLELADRPSPDGHCWPVWLRKPLPGWLHPIWHDGEQSFRGNITDWHGLCPAAGDLLADAPLTDTPRKFYLSIYYEV